MTVPRLRWPLDRAPVESDLTTAATILERRAARGPRVEVSADFAREVARALRELAALKRRVGHG